MIIRELTFLKRPFTISLFSTIIFLNLFLVIPTCFSKDMDTKIDWKKAERFHSKYLDADILWLPGVVKPAVAEITFLPFMLEHKESFKGKTVLDIGTGSGVLALYAANLGASKVVATDIDPRAIANAKKNADLLGFTSIIENRLVPPEDTSAYSVIGADEKFDTIISVPPWILDFDSKFDTISVDKGDLGFSLIKGLNSHLNPQGVAILRYDSLFYHEVLVKYARYLGYNVVDYAANFMLLEEMNNLSNYYLARILSNEGLPADAFRFNLKEDKTIMSIIVRNKMPEARYSKDYPGFIIIKIGEK
jgi:methylase of polypeptide subunit release factors